MRALVTSILLLSCVGLINGCSQERVANRGFSLPIGDAESGRLLFKQHQCVECHTLASNGSNDDQKQATEEGAIMVKLGGTSIRVQTYGDLVTSVINPSHRLARGYPLDQVSDDGQSKMTYYNQVLTVEELVDLVTYLKSQYKFKSYPDTKYPRYKY